MHKPLKVNIIIYVQPLLVEINKKRIKVTHFWFLMEKSKSNLIDECDFKFLMFTLPVQFNRHLL